MLISHLFPGGVLGASTSILTMTACPKCKAIVMEEEKVKTKSSKLPYYSLCCKDGMVKLSLLRKTPKRLDRFLDPRNKTLMSKHFRSNIRMFNSMFAFTSLGAKIDYSVLKGRGPYTFRMHGQNYHRIGSLIPEEGAKPRYAQLYIYDTENEIANRIASMQATEGDDELRGSRAGATSISARQSANTKGPKNGLHKFNKKITRILMKVLDRSNKYVKEFRSVRDWYVTNKNEIFNLKIIGDQKRKGLQYTAPSNSEVAALMIGDNLQHAEERDVIVCRSDSGFQRISETHPSYMPLQYPLLFPYGEDGWHCYLKIKADGKKRIHTRLTMKDFYAYRIQQREGEGNTLLRGGRLFQQFVVDAYAAIEENRLRWIRHNQKDLRCELYQGLQDAFEAGDNDTSILGKKIILPSSFTGGPRYMIQNYQDAMAICGWAGPPDLFITFTCNPNWPEIYEFLKLISGQKPSDRPDIVARVFHMKLNQLLNDLKKKKLFGNVIAGNAHFDLLLLMNFFVIVRDY